MWLCYIGVSLGFCQEINLFDKAKLLMVTTANLGERQDPATKKKEKAVH